jgi:hypothetical protein
MSFTSSLSDVVSLPLVKSGVALAAGAVAGSLASKHGQGTLSNFAAAGGALLATEAISKIVSMGAIPKFNGVAKSIGLISADKLAAVNTDTGALLANLGPVAVADTSVPSGANGDETTNFKVKLSSRPAYGEGSSDIIFQVMPVISESHAAEYDSFNPLHHPGEILKYKSTRARTWSLEAKLISRTSEEASENLKYINVLRSWLMPFYGKGTQNAGQTSKYLGAPPPILTLSGYGDLTVGPISCILETYSWRWPNDIDYIQTEEKTPFPVVVDISLSLKESLSPNEFSNFNLIEYRKGNLPGAFTSDPGLQSKTAKVGEAFAAQAAGAQQLAASDQVTNNISAVTAQAKAKNVASLSSYLPAGAGVGNYADTVIKNAQAQLTPLKGI